MTEYRSHGVPLEEYELTKKDLRAQRDLEETQKWVKIQVAKAPPISPERWAETARLLAREGPPPPEARWRLRLFCGHIVEATRYADCEVPNGGCQSYERCSLCDDGIDQLLVAYAPVAPLKPVGTRRKAKPTESQQLAPPSSRTKAELEAENAELRAEVALLRARDVKP